MLGVAPLTAADPMTLVQVLTIVQKAAGMHQQQATKSALAELLNAAEQHSAALSRIESQVRRLGEAPLRVGLAHLEDAASADHSAAQQLNYLREARECFKQATQTSTDPRLTALAALLCGWASIQLGHTESARRWAGRSREWAEQALAIELRKVPPAPKPASGLAAVTGWLEKFLNDTDLTEDQELQRDAWYAARAKRLGEDVALVAAARAFDHGLDGGAGAPLPLRVLEVAAARDERQIPLVLTESRTDFLFGPMRIRVKSVVFRPHWANSIDGTFQLQVVALADGHFDPRRILFGEPPPAQAGWWWRPTEPRSADTAVVWWEDGVRWKSEYSPGGLKHERSKVTLTTGSTFVLLYDGLAHEKMSSSTGLPAVVVAGCSDIENCRSRLVVLPVSVKLGPPRRAAKPPARALGSDDYGPGIGPVLS